MERLTERFSNGQAAVYGCGNNCKYDFKYCNNHYKDCPTINEIYEKLATYEDAEEQGLLLRLPCRVGSAVYLICSRYTKCTENDQEFDEYSCQGCECLECDSHREYYIYENNSVSLEWIVRKFGEFGETVFLTRKEAEQTLKQMGE